MYKISLMLSSYVLGLKVPSATYWQLWRVSLPLNCYSHKIFSGNGNVVKLKPLLDAVVKTVSDEDIWNAVYAAIDVVFTVTGNLANSSEHRKDIDVVLREELIIHAGVPVKVSSQLSDFAEKVKPIFKASRRSLVQPQRALQGSKALRNLHFGFKQILVPGELKSKSRANASSITWLDLGRYAREILTVQDSRRFVLGFTLSPPFDINTNGQQFVSAVLAFIRLNEEQLGFDPTIITTRDERYVENERDGHTGQLFIDNAIHRPRIVCGSTSTIGEAHLKGDSRTFVIKVSWQYPEPEEAGELLREATEKYVVNVARYYHHETGLEVTKATKTNHKPGSTMPPPSTTVRPLSMKGQSSKRSSPSTTSFLPCNKRTCPSSPVTEGIVTAHRVHRRVILQDYGERIHMASTNPSWPVFIIDLDLSIRRDRDKASGARGKTGTRPFMGIGILFAAEPHSPMHDLESLFCGSQGRVVQQYEEWNYQSMSQVAIAKLGTVANESFASTIREQFTDYYRCLASCV
ncbi:hypothetical protein IQ07DRAFT_615230 [Pyrenochaeta sp. DS3sAY3a]|nr:hypothetical protein IQ07DRAFT_615230 [Pyrenochaeta sp. DS3sAY3a]